MPLKTNKCCCGGSSSPSHSPSSSPSSSPSASPEPPIIIPDCGDSAQYQVTVSGLTNRTISCLPFNRTWALSKDGTVPSGYQWKELVGSRYAIIRYEEPYHVLGFGPHGIYEFTVAYVLEGDWDCGIGATNVFNQAYVFDGCFGWPASFTVTRIA